MSTFDDGRWQFDQRLKDAKQPCGKCRSYVTCDACWTDIATGRALERWLPKEIAIPSATERWQVLQKALNRRNASNG